METFRSPRGRTLSAIGDPTLLTMDRMEAFGRRADSDPRIASLSLTAAPDVRGVWLRSTAPAGCLVVVATDVIDLVGPIDEGNLGDWARRASERGLWHDWFLTDSRDVAHAGFVIDIESMDARERGDASGSHYATLVDRTIVPSTLSIAVDVTWLGPYETGAQVLTTAAIGALASRASIGRIALVGLEELPAYAAHLSEHPSVELVGLDDPSLPADVVWYPNQIDGRSSIGDARALGRRVVTTYLDLIAYDIPRYHASEDSWGVYRALQRKIALSVDGITTISADVSHRLMEEVPRLDPERVQPIPLGLDHISAVNAPEVPDADLADLVRALKGHRFIAVLGNDFQHKNRDFAIAAWERVLQNGQPCDLVLAGLHVKSSSSHEAEADLIARHLDLRGSVHTVGHVSSASRAWLLANAAVVLYPTSAEGFGFVPYEAAILGTPATFTDFGPLREISGVAGLPRSWSLDAYATDLTVMLSDPEAAARRVIDLRRAIDAHSWALFAERLEDFFRRIASLPTVVTAALDSGSAADAAALSAILSSRTWRATEPLRKVGRRLRKKA